MRSIYKLLFLLIFLFSCKTDNFDSDSLTNSIKSQQDFNPENVRMCTEMYLGNIIQPKGALLTSKKWKVGETIKVKFLNGDAFLQGKVIKYFNEWTNYANIKIQYVASNQDADIKVAFKWMGDGGSWSYLGTYCRNIAQNSPSMNFGWFDSNTSEVDFGRTILHEFGHALGLIHEHQHPTNDIQWDKPKVYEYYKRTSGWDAIDVDYNIFSKISVDQTNYSAYDGKSIMHYPIDKSLTLNGYSVGWNSVLSPTDKNFIAKEYPFPAKTTGFYRYYLNNGHHFYTSNFNELGNKYYEQTMGRIYTQREVNTFPIYRYFNKVNGDRLSTLNYIELKGGDSNWIYEGISGYAYNLPQSNTIPVYRYYKTFPPVDHLLTVSSTEVAGGKHGYISEGIAFHILKP